MPLLDFRSLLERGKAGATVQATWFVKGAYGAQAGLIWQIRSAVGATASINWRVGDLILDGPYVQEVGWRRRRLPVPERIPIHIQVQPTVVEIPEPELEPVSAVDNRAIIAALYAAGSIDEDQFTALLAA